MSITQEKFQTEPAASWSVDRRGFLRLGGATAITVGAVSLGLTPTASAATPVATATRAAVATGWPAVEAMFMLDPKVLFMNIGTVGSPPREVVDLVDAKHREIARGAIAGYSDFLDVRRVAAAGYGCDPDELVISHNTSDGMSKILAGLDLSEGDEILTTNHEHPGGLVPMALARDRHGVVIRKVDLPVGNDQRAEDYVALFEKAITARTKIMLFSAPTYKSGTMLPIKLLANLAQSHGLTTVVDGAHVPGMMAYNFHELGVDFLAGSAAKWQCAPGGTGILYIRNKVLSEHNPNPLSRFWPVVSSSYPEMGGVPPRSTGPKETYDIAKYLQSVGNGSLAIMTGVKRSCEIWDEIGRKRIETYILGLSAQLKAAIADRWGVKSLYSPKDDPRLVSALTSFNPFQDPADVYNKPKSDAFVVRLKDEHSIVVRNIDPPIAGQTARPYPLRISTHLFHQSDDVTRLVDAMWQVSRTMN